MLCLAFIATVTISTSSAEADPQFPFIAAYPYAPGYIQYHTLAWHQAEIKKKNVAALDAFAEGRARGDVGAILPLLAPGFTMTGVADGERRTVSKDRYQAFYLALREEVAAAGGPNVTSTDFLRFTNVLRKEWRGGLIETANFEVPEFAKGIYLASVQGGKVLWNEVQKSKPSSRSKDPLGLSEGRWPVALDTFGF